jgi:hypothetical protein
MLWKFFDFNSEMLTDLSPSLHFSPKKMLFGLPWQLYGFFLKELHFSICVSLLTRAFFFLNFGTFEKLKN